ncbi:MAG TPA: DUF763 domain-containing protein [Candidatus Paceibacterota bacterium]|nr:DUF763 domain-containing protein [Candidatus Paceibacterota bacterium]
MIYRGIATFGLDEGKCPRWLFERMTKLGREIIEVIINEYGSDEFIKRISDPVWFQSLGTVLAFDWNSSGLTTILTAALKEAIRGREKELGIFICGGKGKTSRRTPEEIEQWGNALSLPDGYVNSLIYNSKMTAKVDSALVQDGFQIYHHTLFFSKNGSWTVIQQGMNIQNQSARRYHWYSKKITDLVKEPHAGIASQILNQPTLNLTALKSEKTRSVSTQLVQNNYYDLMKDIKILAKHFSDYSQVLKVKSDGQQTIFLNLENREFVWHPVVKENFFKNKYLQKILYLVCEQRPASYEKLLSLKGVGPKTIRALSLVSEIIYGAKPSYRDPARYSFAHGGKDATPYPVDRITYDQSIKFFADVVSKSRLQSSEKNRIFYKLKISK